MLWRNTYKVCKKCKRFIISDISDSKLESKMNVIVGKISRKPDKDGLMRINVEYPPEKRGIITVWTYPRRKGGLENLTKARPQLTLSIDDAEFNIQHYNPSPLVLVSNDKVAFAGIYGQYGFFYPLYYRNLSMGGVEGAFTSGALYVPPTRHFSFENIRTRLHIVAEQVLSKGIDDYNSRKRNRRL